MAYDLARLFEHASSALDLNPRISLRALSRRLHVDRHTLERAIHRNSGKTFRRLQHNVLLRKALKLLTSDEALSVKEVGFLLGYRSSRAFSRLIYVAFGCCPSKLRDKLSHDRTASVTESPPQQGITRLAFNGALRRA